MPLVSLETAKTHLKVEGTEQDAEVARLLDMAVSTVADYLESTADELEETYGDDGHTFVQAAVLLCLTVLFDDRAADPLTPAVTSLLARVRSAGVW